MEKEIKKYSKSPLPFQGQKRNILKQYVDELGNLSSDSIIVDLFGGSGLLSHTAKFANQNFRVIWNDYDNFQERLSHIEKTNSLIAECRHLVASFKKKQKLSPIAKESIIERIKNREEKGELVDYLTLSASLLFSMKRVKSLRELERQDFYNSIKKSSYSAHQYLTGVERTSCDYRVLFEQYKGNGKAVFLFDPPYLETDVFSYTNYWKLKDYFEVVSFLLKEDLNFIYFTSSKSQIVELFEALASFGYTQNPFANCKVRKTKNATTGKTFYMDTMFVKCNRNKGVINGKRTKF